MEKIKLNKNTFKKISLVILSILLTISLLIFLLLFDNSSMNISNINLDYSISDIYEEILFNSTSTKEKFNLNFTEDNINNIIYIINKSKSKEGEDNFINIKGDNYIFKIDNKDFTKSKTIINTTLSNANNNLEFKINNVKLSNLFIPSFIGNKLLNEVLNQNLVKSFKNQGLNINLDLKNKKIIYPIINLLEDFNNIIKSEFYENKILDVITETLKIKNDIDINNQISIKLDTYEQEVNINDTIAFDLETLIEENRNYFIKNNSINYEKLYYVYNYFLYGYDYIENKYNELDPYYILLKEEIDKINFKNTITVNDVDLKNYKTGYLNKVINDDLGMIKIRLDDLDYLFTLLFKGDRKYPFFEINVDDLNNYIKTLTSYKNPLIISSRRDNSNKIKIISIDSLSFSLLDKLVLNLSINLNGKIFKLSIPLEKENDDFFKVKYKFIIEEIKLNDTSISVDESLIKTILKLLEFNSKYIFITNENNYYLNIDVFDLTKGDTQREKNYYFFTDGKEKEELIYYTRFKENNIQFIIDKD